MAPEHPYGGRKSLKFADAVPRVKSAFRRMVYQVNYIIYNLYFFCLFCNLHKIRICQGACLLAPVGLHPTQTSLRVLHCYFI